MKTKRKSTAKYDERRRRFRAALTLAGETLAGWADAHNISHTHLNYVLRGLRASPRIEDAIMARITAALGA